MLKTTTSCLSVDEANSLITKWNGRCAYCGNEMRRACMEHVEPLSRGGEDVPDNIVPACRSCNSAKHDLFLLEWVFYQHYLLRQDHETRLPYAVAPYEEQPRKTPQRLFDAPMRRIVGREPGIEIFECGHRAPRRPRTFGQTRPSKRRRCYECFGKWPAGLGPSTPSVREDAVSPSLISEDATE